jgi:uncharacterized phiE125 gp8 family phage protein
MRVLVVTPPDPVVTWEDADAHLKLDGDTDQQAEVEAMIAAATQSLDGPGGWLGRAIGQQTLELRIDGWPTPCMALPYPDALEIVSVTYLDEVNAEQELAADQYELIGQRFVPAHGATWPRALTRLEAVRIQYNAGYQETPFPIRAAILLMVGDLYRNRDTTAAYSVAAIPMSTTVQNLLAPYRVWG